jgi:hypothetical protein
MGFVCYGAGTGTQSGLVLALKHDLAGFHLGRPLL